MCSRATSRPLPPSCRISLIFVSDVAVDAVVGEAQLVSSARVALHEEEADQYGGSDAGVRPRSALAPLRL